MQQLRFPIAKEEKTNTSPPMPAEQERKLIGLMAQAILALLQQRGGEDEGT